MSPLKPKFGASIGGKVVVALALAILGASCGEALGEPDVKGADVASEPDTSKAAPRGPDPRQGSPSAFVRRRLPGAAAIWFLAGFFLVAGLAALVVGVHDVSLTGGRLGVLFPGALLVIAAILFLGAAWRLNPIGWPGEANGVRPPCKEPVPVALLLSILLGVYVFFGAQAGAGTQRAIVTGISLLFLSAGFLGFVLFWSEIRKSTARVSAGVVLTAVGLAIGGWEFWYQNQYVPSHLDRAVSVQVSLKKLGVQDGYDLLSATLGYEDVGSQAVVVLGSDYTLTGSRIVPCPRQPTAKSVATTYFSNPLPDPQRSRLMTDVWEVQPSTVLAAGRFVADGKNLAPNVPGSRQLILYVPAGTYQLLRFRAQVFAISAAVPLADQSLPLRKPPYKGPASVQPIPKTIPHDNDLYDLWKLGESSWLQDLLSGRRGWIVTRYEVVQSSPTKNQPPSPDLRVTARSPGPSWSGNPPSDAQIESLFSTVPPLDTTETFADAELPLAPPRAQDVKTLQHEKAPHACLLAAGKRSTGH